MVMRTQLDLLTHLKLVHGELPAEYLKEKGYIKKDLVCVDKLYSGSAAGWGHIVGDYLSHTKEHSVHEKDQVSEIN